MRTGSATRINRWWLPFLWLMLTPLVTLPLNVVLFESLGEGYTGDEVGRPDAPPGQVEGWCPEDDSWGGCIPNLSSTSYEYYEVLPVVLAFVLPGLIHLVPFMLRLSKTPRIRLAGLVAGLMGLARLGVSLLVLLGLATDAATAPISGTTYFRVERELLSGVPYMRFWVLSFLAWAACGAAWIVFGILTRASPASGDLSTGNQGLRPGMLRTSRY